MLLRIIKQILRSDIRIYLCSTNCHKLDIKRLTFPPAERLASLILPSKTEE